MRLYKFVIFSLNVLAYLQKRPRCFSRMFTRLSEMSDSHILVIIIVPYVLKETSPQYPRAKIGVEFAFLSCRMCSAPTRLEELQKS